MSMRVLVLEGLGRPARRAVHSAVGDMLTLIIDENPR